MATVEQTIESLRLKHLRDTVKSLFFLLITATVYGLSCVLIERPVESPFLIIALVTGILIYLHLWLFEYRVKKKFFGNSADEALEIIRHADAEQHKKGS